MMENYQYTAFIKYSKPRLVEAGNSKRGGKQGGGSQPAEAGKALQAKPIHGKDARSSSRSNLLSSLTVNPTHTSRPGRMIDASRSKRPTRRMEMEYSDQKRKNLFNGDGIDYIRMRADKHLKVYFMPEQAAHLRKLADELEEYKRRCSMKSDG